MDARQLRPRDRQRDCQEPRHCARLHRGRLGRGLHQRRRERGRPQQPVRPLRRCTTRSHPAPAATTLTHPSTFIPQDGLDERRRDRPCRGRQQRQRRRHHPLGRCVVDPQLPRPSALRSLADGKLRLSRTQARSLSSPGSTTQTSLPSSTPVCRARRPATRSSTCCRVDTTRPAACPSPSARTRPITRRPSRSTLRETSPSRLTTPRHS